MKNITVFLSENFQFFGVKFSIYLNRHVFVMILKAFILFSENDHHFIFRKQPLFSKMGKIRKQYHQFVVCRICLNSAISGVS